MLHADSRARVQHLVERASQTERPILVLTGAGVSADSGIPTFRGPEGYWTDGSRNYHPEELATLAAFRRMPAVVWSWYLHRLRTCRSAEPNAAHTALAELERDIPERFVLVTQNVDGLHLRAGNSAERTWQVHGNLEFARCGAECSRELHRIPDEIQTPDKEIPPALICPRCADFLRPNVLWFDECYDEEHYRFDSSLMTAQRADLLVVIGTTGATRLPQLIVSQAVDSRIPIIAIDPFENPVTQMVADQPSGLHIADTAARAVPELIEVIRTTC